MLSWLFLCRQNLSQGRVAKYPQLPALSDQQKAGICEMSDIYNVNEIICLDYWISVSDAKVRRWLEDELREETGTYESQLSNAAATLFEHDRMSMLEALGLLFKSRHDTGLSPAKKDVVVRFTNKLIGKEAIFRLLQAINRGLSDRATRPARFTRDCLGLLAEDLFLASYLVQVSQSEYESLSSILQAVSELVAADATHDKSEDYKLFSLLALLQVTQMAVLDQTSYLYDRNLPDDVTPVIGNALFQSSESRDGLDSNWKGAKGVKGLAHLAHAILRQPLVDLERAPITDVIWFLQEASSYRGYSYMRLCLVPAIQSRAIGSVDIQPLLCGVMNEFIMVRRAGISNIC
jgi:hypothetical protein